MFKWYAVYRGERYPRARYMAARHWGWDVVCRCGWDSRTGGAIQASVKRAAEDHLLLEHGISRWLKQEDK